MTVLQSSCLPVLANQHRVQFFFWRLFVDVQTHLELGRWQKIAQHRTSYYDQSKIWKLVAVAPFR
jgi:hypothetical protein